MNTHRAITTEDISEAASRIEFVELDYHVIYSGQTRRSLWDPASSTPGYLPSTYSTSVLYCTPLPRYALCSAALISTLLVMNTYIFYPYDFSWILLLQVGRAYSSGRFSSRATKNIPSRRSGQRNWSAYLGRYSYVDQSTRDPPRLWTPECSSWFATIPQYCT